MKLILPKTFIDSKDIKDPLFFLAGPVRGGGNWQEICCREIAKRIKKDFFVVVPCRWDFTNELIRYSVNGPENRFSRQTAWEYYYLSLANQLSKDHKGCIIFWIPKESGYRRRDDGSPYARDTYGELGRWGRDAAFKQAYLVVGAEPGFPGLSQIQKNLELDFDLPSGTKFPIYPTLEETVEQAVRFIT